MGPLHPGGNPLRQRREAHQVPGSPSRNLEEHAAGPPGMDAARASFHIPNRGPGLEAIGFKSGRWLLFGKDSGGGRHILGVSMSEEEGRIWPIPRHLEHDDPGPTAGSYSYPSIIQTKDGSLHATYSYTP